MRDNRQAITLPQQEVAKKTEGKQGTASKRYKITVADRIAGLHDKQELLIEEYEDSLIYKGCPVEPHMDLPTGPPINLPQIDSNGGLHWIAIAEESDDFENATYYQESGDVSKIERFNLNIRLAKKKKGKKLAYQYIEQKGLDICLEDYISALRLC